MRDQIAVDRLDGVDIDDCRVDAVCFELFARFHCRRVHNTRRKDRNVLAVRNHVALAELKLVSRGIKHHGNGKSAQTAVNGAVVVQNRLNCRNGFGRVRGVDNHHVGGRAHHREVLAVLMRRAVLADGDTAVGSTDLDVETGVRHGVADLLIRTSASEHCKAGAEHGNARRSDACRRRDHICLCDTAVDKTLGELFAENRGLRRARKVGVHDKKVFGFAQSRQGFTVSDTGSNSLSHFCTPPLPVRVPRSARSLRPHIRLPSAPCRASRSCFPYKKRPCP